MFRRIALRGTGKISPKRPDPGGKSVAGFFVPDIKKPLSLYKRQRLLSSAVPLLLPAKADPSLTYLSIWNRITDITRSGLLDQIV